MLPKFLVYGKLELITYVVIALASISASSYIYVGYFHDPLPPPPTVYEPLAAEATPAFNKVTILNEARQLWIVEPDSGERRRLSWEGQRCGTPIWSRDGSYLAFVEYLRGEMRSIRAVATADGNMYLLKQPRYRRFNLLSWAPDGHYLACTDRSGEGTSTILLGVTRDTPSFWLEMEDIDALRWSEDSHSLAYMQGDDLKLAALTDEVKTLDVLSTQGMIKTPAWGPERENRLRVELHDEVPHLIVATESSKEELFRIAMKHPIVLAPSPDQQRLAILEQRIDPPHRSSGPVTVRFLAEPERVLSFPRASEALFWSPDNKHIAILTAEKGEALPASDQFDIPVGDHPNGRVRWWIMDTDTGDFFPLIAFNPPDSYRQLLDNETDSPGSYQLWDPAGTRLVLASASTVQEPSQVWIVDVFGDAPPRSLGEGTLAIWSWR